MKESLVESAFGLLIGFGIVLTGVVLFMGGTAKGYAEGYCAAIGGSVLSPTQCNVNDKVVTIP